MRFPTFIAVSLALAVVACGEAENGSDPAADSAGRESEAGGPTAGGFDISTPAEGYAAYDAEAVSAGRLDPAWRRSAEADRENRLAGGPAGEESSAGASSTDESEPGDSPNSESFEDITPETVNAEPRLPLPREGGGPSTLRVQILLDRALFSPGILDGYWGKNTEKAVYWFQDRHGLQPTGEVDRETYGALIGAAGEFSPIRRYTLEAEDVEGPFIEIPDDEYEQAELECMCYSSPLEKLTERVHATPALLRQLNPEADLSALNSGTTLWVPNVEHVRKDTAAAATVRQIIVSRDGYYTHGLDARGEVIFHAPSTLGSAYDPSPTGDYTVEAIAYDPDFHYQPDLFHEVPDEEPDAMLPPGPNSPVGVVWLDLSKPHYGIHGTAEPRTIGYTSSHGCIRLTNWDALRLANRIEEGAPVTFR